VNQGEALLDELADFLELHGLGRKDELVNEHNGSESRDLALRLAGAHANLLLGKPWPGGMLPRQFASGPRNQFKNWEPKYGRIGLIYGSAVGHDPHTDPTLFVGFLTGPDFGRPLCAGALGIDLMLAIWAGPKIQTPDGAIELAAKELRIKHPDAIVLTRNEMGGAGGRWFRLSVRRPFFSLQSESPPLSQEVVYQTLYSWMETTFKSHRLAAAKW
jgi:hypothetical protein